MAKNLAIITSISAAALASRAFLSLSVKSVVRTEASDPDNPRAPASAAWIRVSKLGNFLIVASNSAFSRAISSGVVAMMDGDGDGGGGEMKISRYDDHGIVLE